jgi:hypothetical protein
MRAGAVTIAELRFDVALRVLDLCDLRHEGDVDDTLVALAIQRSRALGESRRDGTGLNMSSRVS